MHHKKKVSVDCKNGICQFVSPFEKFKSLDMILVKINGKWEQHHAIIRAGVIAVKTSTIPKGKYEVAQLTISCGSLFKKIATLSEL